MKNGRTRMVRIDDYSPTDRLNDDLVRKWFRKGKIQMLILSVLEMAIIAIITLIVIFILIWIL